MCKKGSPVLRIKWCYFDTTSGIRPCAMCRLCIYADEPNYYKY